MIGRIINLKDLGPCVFNEVVDNDPATFERAYSLVGTGAAVHRKITVYRTQAEIESCASSPSSVRRAIFDHLETLFFDVEKPNEV